MKHDCFLIPLKTQTDKKEKRKQRPIVKENKRRELINTLPCKVEQICEIELIKFGARLLFN